MLEIAKQAAGHNPHERIKTYRNKSMATKIREESPPRRVAGATYWLSRG